MATNNCSKCGCDDTFLPSPAPCPDPDACVEPAQCSEVVDAKCTRYTGADLACGADVIVPEDTFIDRALANIITLICSSTTNKYIKEFDSTLADNLTILGSEISDCLGLKDGCLIPKGGGPIVQSKADFTVDVYKYDAALTTWTNITHEATTAISINETSGDVLVALTAAPVVAIPVRVILVG